MSRPAIDRLARNREDVPAPGRQVEIEARRDQIAAVTIKHRIAWLPLFNAGRHGSTSTTAAISRISATGHAQYVAAPSTSAILRLAAIDTLVTSCFNR